MFARMQYLKDHFGFGYLEPSLVFQIGVIFWATSNPLRIFLSKKKKSIKDFIYTHGLCNII